MLHLECMEIALERNESGAEAVCAIEKPPTGRRPETDRRTAR
jgi:hypothetical protein